MKFNVLAVIAIILMAFACSGPCLAAEPADNIISSALADVERYESQAASLTPGRSANANRILKLMNLSHERLAGSPNQSDPSWTEVNDRYVALKTQLESLINPAAAGTTTPAAAATSAAQAPTTTAPPASVSSRPAASSAAANSAPPLVSGQRVQVKKLARDLANSRANIVTTGPSPFQDAAIVAAQQKALQQYTDAIGRYPQADDPDVQAARAEYLQYREALIQEFERAKGQMAELGDVQASLAQLAGNNSSYPVPQPLHPPFSEQQAQDWVAAAGSARTVAEHNGQQLAKIIPIAYLPQNVGTPETGAPYDLSDATRMQNYAAQSLQTIQSNYESMVNQLDMYMDSMESDVFSRWQADPEDESKRWLYISDGQEEEATRVFAENRAMVNSAIYLEKALQRDTSKATSVLARLDQAEADFKRKQEVALQGSRLPEPKSTDRKMLSIAEEIISSPRYKFGEHGDIVLTTSEIVERERKDSEIEIDDADVSLAGDVTFSGTETTWTYRWQEFKFATPLKEEDSDEWYIWWITAKNFSSGGARTPLNKWISGEATKGNRIARQNL